MKDSDNPLDKFWYVLGFYYCNCENNFVNIFVEHYNNIHLM